MKSKFFRFLLCLAVILFILDSTPDGFAAAPAHGGRVTAGINLRAAPGLAGKVITGLEAGTVVSVTGEQAGWYQIAYEDDAYGYRGWVYGKYIEMLPEVLSPPDTPSAVLETQLAAAAAKPALRPKTRPADPVASALPVGMPAQPIELIQAASAPQAADRPQTPPGTAETVKTEQRADAGAIARTESLPTKTNTAPDGAAVTRKAAPAAAGPVHLLSVVLKVSSVLLSCLALMISYRTFYLVRAAGRLP